MNNTGTLDYEFKNARFLTVSALNRYINYKFDIDVHLKDVYLKGEISNFKRSGRHMYFSIKDECSEINAIVFYPYTENLTFEPKDGMLIQALGTIKVYEKKGNYAIVIRKMVEDGLGLLYQEYLLLKEKLQKEGLFDEKYKKPLPAFPMKVAVVTSPTGDAIHDIISTFNRRLALAKITIFPALVQGEFAAKDLVRALNEVYKNPQYDVLIIGRGGGSFEDLSCFNDEYLARMLFKSPIPTVSAIGHEADYTICDFVASFRAPTPTGAAMILTKNRDDLYHSIMLDEDRISNALKINIKKNSELLKKYSEAYVLKKPESLLERFSYNCGSLTDKLHKLSPSMIIDYKIDNVSQLKNRLVISTNNIYKHCFVSYENSKQNLKSQLLVDLCDKFQHTVDNLNSIIQNKYLDIVNVRENYLNQTIGKIETLNPLYLMRKGYSIIYQNNKVVDSITKVDIMKPINITMNGGNMIAKVLEIKSNNEEV